MFGSPAFYEQSRRISYWLRIRIKVGYPAEKSKVKPYIRKGAKALT